MKLKIKALTNQNVCIEPFTYPPQSWIECELDTKQIPTYSKAFEEWEIIDPVVAVIEPENVKVMEKVNDEKQFKQTESKPNGKNTTKTITKKS